MENLIQSLRDRDLLQDVGLINAIRNTDIRSFIAPELRDSSYVSFINDRPALAINIPGVQRTISAPHMVCMMLEQMIPSSNEKFLILGSKFGYFATLIFKINNTVQVTVLEANPVIYSMTKQNLTDIHLHQQILVIKKNPLEGNNTHGPFHKILITGAIEEVPEHLFAQLADGGKLMAPVGFPTQDLILYSKSDEFIEEMNLCQVVFSPLETIITSETSTAS